MLHRPLSAVEKTALSLGSMLALAGGYTWLAARQHAVNPLDTTLPTWAQLGDGAAALVAPQPRTGERWLWVDACATATRLALGLAAGVGGAVVIGLLMGCVPAIEAALATPLAVLAKVPPTAMLAVFFVMAGTGLPMFAAMIAASVLPTLAQAVHLAVRAVPEELIHKAFTLGASRAQVLFCVVWRHGLPAIIDAARLQLGPALVALIAAEMICGDAGFGYRIRMQSRLLNMNVVYPYLVILAGSGLLADAVLRWVRRRCCAWVI